MSWFHLSELAILKVSGLDAKKFLQGQLTCDLEKITPTSSSFAAHCNHQGRIISLFLLAFINGDYLLIMPAVMIEIALASLKKYAVFYRAHLETVTDIFIEGTFDKTLEDSKNDGRMITMSFKSQRYMRFSQTIASVNKEHERLWKLTNIEEELPNIYPSTTGLFLPHDLGLHKMDAVSFNKGCYTGQEIIARMHYKGKLKNHMIKIHSPNLTAACPGNDISAMTLEQKKINGTIIDVCHINSSQSNALILIQDTYIMMDQIFLGTELIAKRANNE